MILDFPVLFAQIGEKALPTCKNCTLPSPTLSIVCIINSAPTLNKCPLTLSNFQSSVKSNPGLLCFCFTSSCDWSRKLTPPFQPIRFKTKINRVSVARVFPCFRHFACFHFKFSLAPCNIFLLMDYCCD